MPATGQLMVRMVRHLPRWAAGLLITLGDHLKFGDGLRRDDERFVAVVRHGQGLLRVRTGQAGVMDVSPGRTATTAATAGFDPARTPSTCRRRSRSPFPWPATHG